nr:translation initiation factor IF-2-like [Aegilops tauschii subsp. strangulata]
MAAALARRRSPLLPPLPPCCSLAPLLPVAPVPLALSRASSVPRPRTRPWLCVAAAARPLMRLCSGQAAARRRSHPASAVPSARAPPPPALASACRGRPASLSPPRRATASAGAPCCPVRVHGRPCPQLP